MGKVDVPFAKREPATGGGAIDSEVVEYHKEVLDDDSPAIDLRAIWSVIYRNRLGMIAIVVVALLLGVVSILVMPQIYVSRSSIQIEQQTAKVLGTEDTQPIIAGAEVDRFLQTQVDVLSSRAMARRVSESLGLATNDKFLQRMSGKEVKLDSKGASRAELVLDTLEKNLNIDLRRNSQVVGILFTSRDPALAAEIANSYAKNFIEGNMQRKFSSSAYSRQFLSSQLEIAKARLEGSERDLIAYARSARLIDASTGATEPGASEGPRSLITANLVQLNTAYAESEGNRLRAQQRWEEARVTPLMSLPDVLSNSAVQQLTQKRAEEIADLNELRRRLKPDHPTVIQSTAQIAALEQQINSVATSIRESIRNQYLTAERQHVALTRRVNALKGATLAEQDRSVRYNILKREVDTNRQLYESLLQRFKETTAESGITTNNVTIVDAAEVPRKPTSPRKSLNLALALAAGLVLAMIFAFGREYLDDALRDPQDIEDKLGIPVLGVTPEEESGQPMHALLDPKSPLAEAYHTVRMAIELSSNQGLQRSILVTGSSKSEGKSTTSYALARDFSLLGRRVLLIDADLRRPSLHRIFGITQTENGLSSVLARRTMADSAIIENPGNETFSFMPSGPLPPDPATLFAGTAVAELLADLSDTYDVILLDGPPVLALADATQLSASVEATVFVAEAGGAHLGQVRNAVSRLNRVGGNLIGCVVTKYNARKAGYAKSYDYYRYRYGDEEVAK